MADKRFDFKKPQGVLKGASIVVDNKTGVQYLFVESGYAGGLTLLVDKDGKPMIDPEYPKEGSF